MDFILEVIHFLLACWGGCLLVAPSPQCFVGSVPITVESLQVRCDDAVLKKAKTLWSLFWSPLVPFLCPDCLLHPSDSPSLPVCFRVYTFPLLLQLLWCLNQYYNVKVRQCWGHYFYSTRGIRCGMFVKIRSGILKCHKYTEKLYILCRVESPKAPTPSIYCMLKVKKSVWPSAFQFKQSLSFWPQGAHLIAKRYLFRQVPDRMMIKIHANLCTTLLWETTLSCSMNCVKW